MGIERDLHAFGVTRRAGRYDVIVRGRRLAAGIARDHRSHALHVLENAFQAPEASDRETFPETVKMRLIELDGRRAGPVDRGECTDLLQVRVFALWLLFVFRMY